MSVRWTDSDDYRPAKRHGINWGLIFTLLFCVAFWMLFAFQVTGGF